LPVPEGAYLYHFTDDDRELVVGWSTKKGTTAMLPQPASEAISRDGNPLPGSDGTEIILGPSPTYYRLR
jgi:hypothetical protein